MGLTRKQELVLIFIKDFLVQHGHSPTFEEIRQHFEFRSVGTVYDYIKYLEKAGLLKNQSGTRGFELVEIPEGNVNVPLLGTIAAGEPLEIMDHLEFQESVPFPESSMRKGRHFALKVEGSSMIEDGILDGDIILVRSARLAQNGETVVAIVDNGATVKNFYQKGNHIELHPANSAMKPIILDKGGFKIQGIVVGLRRDYGH